VSGRGYHVVVSGILPPAYPLPGTWPASDPRSLQLTPTSGAPLYSWTSPNEALTWYCNVLAMSPCSSPGSVLKSHPTINRLLLVAVEVHRLRTKIANS
jgi:hypothetical protein